MCVATDISKLVEEWQIGWLWFFENAIDELGSDDFGFDAGVEKLAKSLIDGRSVCASVGCK